MFVPTRSLCASTGDLLKECQSEVLAKAIKSAREWQNANTSIKTPSDSTKDCLRLETQNSIPAVSQGSASTEVASVLIAEALALKAAMKAAIDLNIKDLICFSDSKSFISLITGNKSVIALQRILHDICVLNLFLNSIFFKFINRSCNSAADQLAKNVLFSQNSVLEM
ncbi:uncharacterized protein LOC108850210 [Raphanus sativus]|uniref:Uncharacterized protein LOC108850210 n=1 Tax=Raphanus sativus TaxID=3726 RepID=A0A6J0N3Q6_RAPSA|nr:uncharacterized protein LOC108850210 [Raphanus sativus]